MVGNLLTVSIKIVADCGLLYCQVKERLKRATTLRIPLKPLLAMTACCSAYYHFLSFVSFQATLIIHMLE